VHQLNTPLTNVAVPTLSRLQHEESAYRSSYFKAIRLLSTATMPLAAFMFVDADVLVRIVLGGQWLGAVPIFRAFAPAAFLTALNAALAWVYLSIGTTGRQLRWGILSAVVTLAGYVAALPYGPVAVAGTFSACAVVLMISGVFYCYRISPLEPHQLLANLWRPAVASILAGAGVLAVVQALTAEWHVVQRLAIEVFLFAVLYGVSWLAMPGGISILREMWGVGRELVYGRPAGSVVHSEEGSGVPPISDDSQDES
jgi:PST family polysaccharide transporter